MWMTKDGILGWGYPSKELVADLEKQREVQDKEREMRAKDTREAVVGWLEYVKANR